MNAPRQHRQGFTLIELIVVICITTILVGLLLSAIQHAREAARRVQCQNRIRQLTLALHLHHDAHRVFPSGVQRQAVTSPKRYSSWIVGILPYLEESALAQQVDQAYTIDPFPFNATTHPAMAHPLAAVRCPSDSRAGGVRITRKGREVALTSFLGVSGTNANLRNGVLFDDSRVSLGQVGDGTSQTLLLGERPGSPDSFYGWWYAGVGQHQTGSLNMVLGVREVNLFSDAYGSCWTGPYRYKAGFEEEPCDRFHFWSMHPGGANFALCDGSVRFIPYESAPLLEAWATINDKEVSSAPP